MPLDRHDKRPSVTGRLADVAQELALDVEWETRLQNVLSMLREILSSDLAALAVFMDEWKTVISPQSFEDSDLPRNLITHHAALANIPYPPNPIASIAENKPCPSGSLTIPILGDDRFLGVLHIGNKNGSTFSQDNVNVLAIAASLIGLFLRNVIAQSSKIYVRQEVEALETAYEREHLIADTFQRALITDVARDLPGLSIDGKYLPALKEAEIGGDFYDVFDLADGKLAIVVGDVSGKGLRAAVHMSTAKNMLRAYAHEDPDPCYVIERLNQAMCTYTPENLFVTIFYGVLDPVKRTLVYSNAGHDEPVLYRYSSNSVITLDVTGRAVGIIRQSGYDTRFLRLEPGDVLLIYTDGITDARNNGHFFGIEGVSRVLIKNAGKKERAIADAVFEAASAAAAGDLRDDAAVLLIKTKL
ncbi:MAG: GAF domain-containing SpoIIE family protein phosphatase [Armatimonadota bacterium]